MAVHKLTPDNIRTISRDRTYVYTFLFELLLDSRESKAIPYVNIRENPFSIQYRFVSIAAFFGVAFDMDAFMKQESSWTSL